ncbi:hypothetical protein Scep_002579 [Stephania cephalantha]|uniref:Carbonic anhydrase n=1 Tax=Stephania cephalantha TaxID=152367 RepID=A0AAP0LBH2_9MAGN
MGPFFFSFSALQVRRALSVSPASAFTSVSAKMAALLPFSVPNNNNNPESNPFVSSGRTQFGSVRISCSTAKMGKTDDTHLRLVNSVKTNATFRLNASRESMESLLDHKMSDEESLTETGYEKELFDEMKHRFLNFKRLRYLQQLDHFQKLANSQEPKFMIVSCADSRVCPSNILGFQPGEAFVVRNVANLVPPFENEPSETSAALEFAVNSLKVQNLLVTGHSRCGGIRALMSMEDEGDSSSFINKWVAIGKNARSITKTAASNLGFDRQCRHCEKESVNQSLMNLLTYPWIKEKVIKGSLFIHGGYYDFVNCTYEKWALDFKESDVEEGGRCTIKDKECWM